MGDWLHRMVDWLHNIGKPRFDLGNDDNINHADKLIDEVTEKRKSLEERAARLKLLDIQSTPRGPFRG